MINFNNINSKYLLGSMYNSDLSGIQNVNLDNSIFSDVQNLFTAGTSEENFITKYQQLMAGSLNVFDDENSSFGIESISSEELGNIEEVAKNYFKLIDKDGNGIISEEEIHDISLIDGDDSSLSEYDIEMLTKQLFTNEAQTTDNIEITKPQSTHSSNGSSNVGDSYNSQQKQESANSTETMTLEQIQSQKAQKQSELNNAQNSLKSTYKQGNADVNSAKESYNNAVQNDESISKELKEQHVQISSSYSSKEQELGVLKANLIDVNSNISNLNSIISAKTSEFSALNSALNNLDDSKPDSDKLKTEINEKLVAAEKEKADAQDKLSEANKQKNELTAQISQKENELGVLKDKQTEVDNLIANSSSDATKQAFENYQKVKSQSETAINKAEANIVSLQSEIVELDKQINEKQASKIQTDYRQTKLDKTYTLNGEEYLSLFSQNELNAFLNGEFSRGNYNKNSNCLSMSYQYSKDIMKQLGISGNCTDFINDSQEEVEQKAREALDNGYPVIMHVSTQRGTRHFATAVGYRVTDEGKLVFLLADNVKGVGITACGENERRHMITGYSTPYSNQNYGFRCLFYS